LTAVWGPGAGEVSGKAGPGGSPKRSGPLSRRTTGRPRRLVVVFGLVIFLAAVNGLAATTASAATNLEVSAGWSGFHVPGRAVPVRVTVTADRLLRADLLARAAGGDREAVRLPVEVAGGSVKRFVLLLPPGAVGGDGDVRVELRSQGRTLARGDAPLHSADGTELVGLLPGALAGRPVPGAAALAVDAGLARFSAVDPADLARGPLALDALSTVGLTPGELAALAPSARTGLLAWVAAGGRLLIDGPPGDAVPGLPAGWAPLGPSGRAAAGRGEIRLTGEAIATGRWAGLVEPTPLGRNLAEGFFSGDSVANAVARDAGLRLPRLATLLGFLAVYVLAVGPLTAVVLRRRRRPELAWVVVPALAVAFTVASYAAGTHARGGIHMAHGSVVETEGESAVATTFVGLTRSGAGSAHVGFPPGWTVRPALGDTGTSSLPVVEQADGGPEAELPLDLGQFGFVKATGPTHLPGALQVTATADGEGARGTVRNRLPYGLEEVTVFLGTAVAPIGRLGPGEERTWSISTPFSPDQGFGREWFRRFPGEFFGNDGPAERDGPVNLGLWQATRAQLGADLSAPGSAVAVGWTRSFHPDVRLDGKARSVAGRTALLARAPVTAPAGSVPAVAVHREVVRGPFPSDFGWGGAVGPDEATVLRFTLPAGQEAARPLVLRSTVALQSVEVWRDGVWQQVGPIGLPAIPIPVPKARGGFFPPPPALAPPPQGGAVPVPVPSTMSFNGGGVLPAGAEVPIPGAVVSGGVVFLRVRGNFFDGGGSTIITLGETA
jgi:hypothetical protein